MKRRPAKIRIWNFKRGARRSININGKWINYARWLYEKEVRPLKPGEVVHHKDEDKLNDCIENYEAKQNGKHVREHMIGRKHNLGHKHTFKTKTKIGNSNRGENHPKARLTQRDVEEIRHRYYWEKDITGKDLMDLYKVSSGCIEGIVYGTNWNPDNLSKDKIIEKSRILIQ